MHRFYLPPDECQDSTLFLRGREAHHALRVVRVHRGERILVLDGVGAEFLCEVQEHDHDKVKLGLVEKRSVSPLPYRITLLQAVPKGKLIESIIHKATELGVYRIVPLLSQRVVTRLQKKGSRDKARKWQLTAVEAIKQCGSAWLPQVDAPLTPSQFLLRGETFDLRLLASLQSDCQHPRHYFRAFQAQHGHPPKSVCAWIGPEGDFTPAETDAIKASGALPITLGSLVLRTETAATYCLSILNYELQSPTL